MYKESITPQDVCDLLNEFLKLDHDCALHLILRREICNENIANHPTIQAQTTGTKGDELSTVNVVGLLNGMFGVRDDNMGPICCEIDDNGRVLGFKLTPRKAEPIVGLSRPPTSISTSTS